ncbi:hypothetical protein BDR26DRAFT_652485 [Obelidium mucronatum]|nr:hypothetical protein BDR26DRAFT_652485 [Obelidium mucronatum]
MQFDSFGAESLLDGETPPIFLDDAEADEDEFGDAVVPGSSWTAGFGAMADSIPFWSESHHDSDRDIALEDDSSKEQGLDSWIVSGHDAVVSIVADIEENVADLVEAVENAVETMVEASEEEIVRMIAELSASEDIDPVTVPIVAATIAEQEFVDVREELEDSVRDGSLSTESVQAEEGIDSPAQPATEPLILADDAESVIPPHASSLKTQGAALLLTSRPSTPSTAITAVSADEISHDLITTLNVTYTMTLEEEVAAAEEAHRLANGLPSVNIQSADEVDNPSEEAELDPEFLWDNGGPREEEESVDGDEDGPAGGDGNVSFVEVLTAPLPTTTSTDHPLAAVEPICLLNSLVSESEDIVDGGNNNTDKDEDAGKSGALDETNDPERDSERTPISPIPSLNGSAVETVASVRDSGYIASVAEEEIFVETQQAISGEQQEFLELQRVDSDGDAETVGDEDDADTVVSEDDHCNDDSFQNESDDPGNPLLSNLDIATTNSIVEGAPDDHADLQIGETSPEICHLESCKDTVELSAVSVDGALDTMIVRVEVADSTVDDLERLSGVTDPSVLDGLSVPITKHSYETLTTEAPFQASAPSATSFDVSVPIFELSVENLIAETPAQASTSSSTVENSVEIKSSGVDQESDTSLRIATNLVPESSNPSSTRVRTSFLPMARVKSLTGTTSTSKSIQTPLQTVRRQQTLSSLPQQQPRPPTPSQPPPAMARTPSQQRQTTIPRPLSFSGSPSAVPQSPSTSHTHPFLRKGRTTPTPPLQQTLLRKPTPPMPTPSPRTTPSPSSSIGSAPSTPPPSPHSPHLVARQPTKPAIAYKPVLKGTLTKSSSTVQLTTAERSGSKLVPTSARRASQVVRSNSDPSVPVAPFLSALNRRVEQPGGSVALRRTISTTMVAPSPPARSNCCCYRHVGVCPETCCKS